MQGIPTLFQRIVYLLALQKPQDHPLEYMSPKLPGLGDVDWGAFVSALNDIRYNGNAVIEVEDKAFESCKEDVLKSIRLSKRYLDNFII